MTDILQHLRRAVFRCDGANLSDGQLLEYFLSRHDEEAFAALVQRHGPMVWGVCHRLLRSLHDTEDAFQATFLVLARKGASVQPRESVGNFLYGVAYRTALRARSLNAKRQQKESRAVDRSESQPAADEGWLELLPHLDRELNRLPDKYRLPVVLCDLEGRSRKDVARQLQIPEGTLSSRLATARKRLSVRLRSHGLTLAGGALAVLLARNAASACVPKTLVIPTVRAGMLVAAGQATAGIVSSTVVTLTEGVVKAMLLTKLRIAIVALLATTFLAAGASLPAYRIWAKERPEVAESAAPVPPVPDEPTPPDPPAATEPAPAIPAVAAEPPQGPPPAPKREILRGSGKLATKEFKLAGFTSVNIGSIFEVTITQGEAFRTAVTADDNVFPFIKVTKEDADLRVFLDTKDRNVQNVTLKATITMPNLTGLKVSGTSKAKMEGFKKVKDFQGKVTGASVLRGEIQADSLHLEVIGASRAELKGRAKKATLSVTGASRLQLADLDIDQASAQILGASHATLRVKKKLDYTLHGASHLEYRGEPELGKHTVTGVSSVSRK